MRLKIWHRTTYRYSGTVRSAIQLLRLTPRSTEGQFVRKWRVMLDADVRLDRGEDAYGNITHLAFIEGSYSELDIVVEGEVDTTDTNGIVRGSYERQSETFFLRETNLTVASPAIRALARDAFAAEGGDRIAALHRINTTLNSTMRFDTRATTSATTAEASFAAGAGVCQDFAHIFIAAVRSAGVPARYVSGYYLRTDRIDQDAGHAWAEAYVPGLGWVAFDPAQGLSATDRYVRVAVGSDGNEAAPIRGARSGGDAEALTVAITVSNGQAVHPPSPPSQSQSQNQ